MILGDYVALARIVHETDFGMRRCRCGHVLRSHNLLRGGCLRTGCVCDDFEEARDAAV